MLQLFLLRHAKSSWDDPAIDDFDRPLNDRGRNGAAAMAGYIRAAGIQPALVLCSAAKRTRQTWEHLEPHLAGVPAMFEDGLYAADRQQLTERLRLLPQNARSVMVIGHNPGLERTAGHLADGQGAIDAVALMSEKFPTGALAVLECDIPRWRDLDRGTCRLSSFVRPSDAK